MQTFPLVDIIIPVFNRDGLLRESIETVINQSYKNTFLYVIEDGSNLTAKLVSSFTRYKNIAFIQLNTNQGVSYCRNLGASLGKGKYIAFLDSDDLWEKPKIEKQVEFLESHSEINWVHTNETWVKNGIIIPQKKEHKKQGGKFLERLFERCLISPSSVFFRRSFFESEGWFLPHFRVAEDYELWLRLNLKHPVGFLEEPLTVKRAGEWEQLSRTTEIDKWRVLAMHRLYRLYRNDPDFLEHFQEWKFHILKKTNILIQGAKKYNHVEKLIRYQNWLNVFNTF